VVVVVVVVVVGLEVLQQVFYSRLCYTYSDLVMIDFLVLIISQFQ
jgi:hypothetical protein